MLISKNQAILLTKHNQITLHVAIFLQMYECQALQMSKNNPEV